jgi:hypothetical protein
MGSILRRKEIERLAIAMCKHRMYKNGKSHEEGKEMGDLRGGALTLWR